MGKFAKWDISISILVMAYDRYSDNGDDNCLNLTEKGNIKLLVLQR
jgi:hypothetical protein